MNTQMKQDVLMELDRILFEVRRVAMSSNPSDYVASNYEIEKLLSALTNKLEKEFLHGE